MATTSESIRAFVRDCSCGVERVWNDHQWLVFCLGSYIALPVTAVVRANLAPALGLGVNGQRLWRPRARKGGQEKGKGVVRLFTPIPFSCPHFNCLAFECLVILEQVNSDRYWVFNEWIKNEATCTQVQNAKRILCWSRHAGKLLKTGVAPTIKFQKQ